MRWLVVIDDPKLLASYRAEVEAPERGDALKVAAVAACEHSAEHLPGFVFGEHFVETSMSYGAAVPLEGVEQPCVDLGELRP